MIGALLGFGNRHVVENSEGRRIALETTPHDITHPIWIADNYELAYHLGRDEKATAFATAGQSERGKSPVLMAAPGSAAFDLWSRLTHFGYLAEDEKQTPDNDAKIWRPVSGQSSRWMLFLSASKVDLLHETNLRVISKKLAKARPDFNKYRIRLLEALQRGTTPANESFADGSINGQEFKVMQRLGLIERGPSAWAATRLGSLILPFFFEHLAHEKRAALEEANR